MSAAPAFSEFDRMVEQIMTQWRVPRDKAEAAARRELGIEPGNYLEEIRDEALIDDLEDDVMYHGDRLMQSLGFVVIRLSQKRRSKITAGVPDRRYYHQRRRLKLWWEAKSVSGRQRPEQREFQLLCDSTDDPYVLGGLDALRAWLVEHRVAAFDEHGMHHSIPMET